MNMLYIRSAVLISVFSAALSPIPFAGLGLHGHQTVALIAEKHLTSEARQLVDKLLTENPTDPQLKRYCGTSGRDLLTDSSTWPDDVRNEVKNGPWHYIDIPRGAPRDRLDQFCGSGGCVTKVITDQLAILKDKNAAPRKRADALGYLAHFVGDLHMPLHTAINNDEGGNCVPVRYFRRRPHEQRNSFTPNLHALWDTAMLERDTEGADPSEYADLLEQSFGSKIAKWQTSGIHVEDWARESHDLRERTVYGELVPKVPVEPPVLVHSCADANNIGERMRQLGLYAGRDYQDAAAPVIQEQIALAGVRLAMILNDAAKSLSAGH